MVTFSVSLKLALDTVNNICIGLQVLNLCAQDLLYPLLSCLSPHEALQVILLEELRSFSQRHVCYIPVDLFLMECFSLGTWGGALQPYIQVEHFFLFFPPLLPLLSFSPFLPFFLSLLSFLGRFLLRRGFVGIKKSLESTGLKTQGLYCSWLHVVEYFKTHENRYVPVNQSNFTWPLKKCNADMNLDGENGVFPVVAVQAKSVRCLQNLRTWCTEAGSPG